MKRGRSQPERFVPAAGGPERPLAGERGNEIGKDRGDERGHRDLRRNRQHRVARELDAVQSRHRHQRQPDSRPDQHARQQGRSPAPHEGTSEKTFNREDHERRVSARQPQHADRSKTGGEEAVPRAEENGDRQCDDATKRQRHDGGQGHRVDQHSDGTAQDRDRETRQLL